MRTPFSGRTKSIFPVVSAVACALLMSGTAARVQAGPQAKSEPRVIRWVVAHDRGNTPFSEINRDFARRLFEKSGGELKIEFIKNDAPDSELDDVAYGQVSQGAADMSQLAATGVRVRVFDMPMLFRNYEHAEAVFEGPVGKRLVAGISAASEGKIRGFAFTYSGGYRILVGKIALRSLSDFKNARLRRGTAHLAPFMAELGAALVDAGAPSRERPITGIAAGSLDLEETEVNKLALIQQEHPEIIKQLDFVNLTRHRMYVTAIVANEKFFSELTGGQRRVLGEEMQALAVAERKMSVDMEKRNLELLAKKGVRFVEFPKAARQEFNKAGEAYHHEVPELESLVAEIRAVKENSKLARK